VLDFNKQETASQGTIKNVRAKRKGSDAGGITWDIDIAFDIDSPEKISNADSVMRGAALLIGQGETDGAHYTLRNNTEWANGRLWITSADEEPLVNGSEAEIRFTVLTVTSRLARAVTRFRVGGIGADRIGLFDNLGEDIDIKFESNQQQFKFEKRKSEEAATLRTVHEGEIVELVSGNCGVAQSVSDENVTVVDIDNSRWSVTDKEIKGAFRVTGSTGDGVGPELTRYKQRCAKKNKRASWKDIIAALAEQAAEGGGPGVNGWVIDSDVLDIAVKRAASAPKDVPRAADA
jgi:hypothetical protein